jgi:hypothetical protein
MAWYDDERKESHTQRYANAGLAAQDAHRAEAKGWQVLSRTTASGWPLVPLMGHMEVNYQRGEVELTFTRTEAWLEQHRKMRSSAART